MKHFILYVCLTVVAITNINSQNNILVVDYNNAFSSDQSTTWNKSQVYNRLVATNTTVTRIPSIPATINIAYDACWIFGNMGTTNAANLNPVVNYINAGGSVYVQSEVSCCPNQAAYVDNLINAVTIAGGSITHNLIKSYKFEAVIHPDVICNPFPLRYGASARLFVGTPNNNILFEANTTCGTPLTTGDVMGVRFSACDMIGGRGGLISNGDFNIFPQGTCTATGILGTPNNPNIIDMIDNLLDSLKNCKTLSCPVLPIEYLAFEGKQIIDDNHLFWVTTSEINNDYFTVERSSDAMTFEPIGIVDGAGNSNVEIDYKFIDENVHDGVNFYRIKQTDFNGDYSFSKMIALEKSKNFEIAVFPSLATDIVTLKGDVVEIANFKLYNALGQNVNYLLTTESGSDENTMIINVSNLAKGMYILRTPKNTQKFYKD